MSRLVARLGDLSDLSALVPGLRTATASATSRGITERLPYVADLGVDAIWLSPIFTSPMADMGYDVSDYTDIDPIFGSLADFDALLERAHELGLKVIIDQVLSHSLRPAPVLQGEPRRAATTPRPTGTSGPTRSTTAPRRTTGSRSSAAAPGPGTPRRHQYYLHNFLAEQPDFNFHNPEVQDWLLGDHALLARARRRRLPPRHRQLLLPRQAAARRPGRLPAQGRAGGESLRHAVPPLLEEPAGEPRLPRADAQAPRRVRGARHGRRDGREPPRDPDDGRVHHRQAAA